MVGPAAEAYIIMRADGTLIPRDVKAFAKDAGEGFGEEFSDAVDEEIENAGKAGIKRFHQRLGKSIAEVDFDPLRKKGEALDDMFERLSDSVDELFESSQIGQGGIDKYTESFSKWATATNAMEKSLEDTRLENEALTESSRRSANELRIGSRLSVESAKARGKDQRAVEGLGESLTNLAAKHRVWMQQMIETARKTDNWDPFIKKVGGLDMAMDALRESTDEVRSSTDVYNNVLAETELSLGKYIEATKQEIAQAERIKKLKDAEAENLKKRTAAEKERTLAVRESNKENDKQARILATIANTYDKVTDASRKTLDSLIVDASVTGNWDKLHEQVRKVGYGMDETSDEAEILANVLDVVSDRIVDLSDQGAINEETFDALTRSMDKYKKELYEANIAIGSGAEVRKALIGDFEEIGDRAGRAFGKGSRNDFLNFFGSLVGGISKFALTAPVKLFGGMATAVETTMSSFKMLTGPVEEGGKGFSKMASIIPSLAQGLGTVAKGAAGGLTAIVFFSQAIGALASAVSLTGGLLVIFGNAIWASVAAPLLAAVPALVSFGAGAVVAGVAISKWAENSAPLKRALSGISDELDKVAVKITPAMDGLAEFFGEKGQSIVRMFGDSSRAVLQDLYDKLDDPAMQKFYDAWSVYMPDIFESLGKSIGSFTTGLTAFFVPILPYAEKLANAIERAADRFSEWAQSSEGQNSIRDWMSKAWKTATDLWSGLKDIGSALGNIFGMADGEGGNFASWIKDIGDRFEKWTDSEEGRESIKQWLKDAEKFGKDLKGVLDSLGKAFDTLDSPAGRDALGFFMGAFQIAAGGAQMLAMGIETINSAISTVGDWLNENLYGFDAGSSAGWAEEWTEEVEMWKGYVDNIKGWWDGAWKWVEDINFTEMWNGFTSALSDWWSSIGTWFSDKGTEIGDTVSGWFDIDWEGVWTSITEGLSNGWDSFTTWLSEKGTDIEEKVKGWFDIDWAGMFDSAGVAIETFFNDMVYAIGLAIGTAIRVFLEAPGKILEGWDAAWKWVEEIEWGQMWDGFTEAIENAFTAAVDWVEEQWDAAWQWVEEIDWTGMWNGMIEGIKSAFNSAVAWVDEQWDAAWQWVEDIEWGKMWDGILEGVKAPFNDAWNWLREQWDSAWQWVEEIEWGEMWDGMVDGLREKWDAVWKFFEDIDWTGIFQSVKDGIADGITSIGSWLLEKGSKLFDSFIQGIKDALGIASPSQKMIELMGYVGEGILQGLTAIPGKLISAVTAIATGIINGIKTGLSTIGTVVSEKFTEAKNAITSKATEIGSAVSSKFGEMPGKAKSALSSLGSSVSGKFEEARSGAVSKASSLVSGAKTNLSKMGSSASSAMSNLSSNIGSRFSTATSNAKSKATSLVSGAKTNLSRMGSSASSALSNLSSQVGNRFSTAISNAKSKATSLVSGARSNLSRMGSSASSALSNLSSSIGSRFTTAKSNAVSMAGRISSEVRSKIAGIPGLLRSALSGVTSAISNPFQTAYNSVSRILGQIRSAAATASSLASNITQPSKWSVPWNASGGMYSGAQIVGVGEAGPEAIVPLNRPLASVDPSVRWLSAIAQGMTPAGGGGGVSISPGAIQIVTPYADPAIVAHQTLDAIVANF